MGKVNYVGAINRDIPGLRTRKFKEKVKNEELMKDIESEEKKTLREIENKEEKNENQGQSAAEEKEVIKDEDSQDNYDFIEKIGKEVEENKIEDLANGAEDKFNSEDDEENKFTMYPENYDFNYEKFLNKDYIGEEFNTEPFDLEGEMIENGLQFSDQNKDLQNNLKTIMDNFTLADQNPLWNKFLKTEKEEKKSNTSLVLLIILLLMLFDKD